MADIFTVKLSKWVKKDLRSLPFNVLAKLEAWTQAVKNDGLKETRKIPGFHDEPLKGKRKGQRSIRLSKAYRAFYIIDSDGTIQFINIIEVNKHGY